MGKNKNSNKCRQCEFYDKETKSCEIKNIKEYSKQEIKNCEDFLVKEKLVMF